MFWLSNKSDSDPWSRSDEKVLKSQVELGTWSRVQESGYYIQRWTEQYRLETQPDNTSLSLSRSLSPCISLSIYISLVLGSGNYQYQRRLQQTQIKDEIYNYLFFLPSHCS